MKKTILLLSGFLFAGMATGAISGSSPSVAIDSRVGVVNRHADTVPYDSTWVGGNTGATVVIADNGTEVKRTTGTGSVPLSVGRHVITYTMRLAGSFDRLDLTRNLGVWA